MNNSKNKMTAGLLGIFLGAYGAHHFYLGDSGKGLLFLLLSLLTGVCCPVFAIIGLIDGIRYLGMSDEEFQEYCDGVAVERGDQPSKRGNGVLQFATEKYKLLLEFKSLLDAEAITPDEFELIKGYIMR